MFIHNTIASHIPVPRMMTFISRYQGLHVLDDVA